MARGRGHPKKFESGEQLISLWKEFCEEIMENEYQKIPSQTNFCKWLEDNYDKTDIKTIYNSLNEYFPSIKKDFEAIRADTLNQGAMTGHWNSTMCIFALKNWCKWQDKPQTDTDTEMLNKLDAVLDKINGE